ncbi:MAG: EAL domain-containing protein [Bryobacterales bacterium]|nr:EAL domain-containing protein [Bryobacterales bacterium]
MQSTTGAPVHVSFNLSQKQFQSPDLLDRLASIVHHAQVDPGLIQIEVTETVVSTYAETALRLAALKTHGFALAVDDFGTGYSSLSLLHTFALDVLKIDRSFIARMDSGGLEIVRTIVALARALGMKVVAEGIETVQQARQVAELGCEYGQGYWLGKPMDIHAAASLLIHRGSQPAPLKRQENRRLSCAELAGELTHTRVEPRCQVGQCYQARREAPPRSGQPAQPHRSRQQAHDSAHQHAAGNVHPQSAQKSQ